MLSRMLAERWAGLSVLYVCPLKALMNSLGIRLQDYAVVIGRRVEVWHGDVVGSQRARIGREPPDLLLATPESLEVMLVSRPTELAGRSRWVGASQPMHLGLCQAIAEVLGGAESTVNLSKRAQAKLQEARADHPWVEKGSTALIRRPSGVVEWWNFAGRTLNAVLAEHFRQLGIEAACDQVQVIFPVNADLRAIRSAIQQIISAAAPVVAVPHAPHDLPELKFSACVPDHLLTHMLATQMDPSSALEVLCAQGCHVLHVP